MVHILFPLLRNAVMDSDLRSIQQARTLVAEAAVAQDAYHTFDQVSVDRIVSAMIKAGIARAESLAEAACKETGFGRVESKTLKNLFATRTLGERIKGMKTCGVIRKTESDTVWEIASPMGVVAALVPSTNPTSTAMYKAIIAAKARCAIVISPHPRAVSCIKEALDVVAGAAYEAGAPEGLFGCMTEISLDGTNALLEDPHTDVILATGGAAMVRSAYSKGKPAYGVGPGNVPVYVDRSADLEKAAKDIVYGAYFDHGTLCSTERSIVADTPIKKKLIDQLRRAGAYILDDVQKDLLSVYVVIGGALNIDQVGKSPSYIAEKAGFSVPPETHALVAEVDVVGKAEPLSMETLSRHGRMGGGMRAVQGHPCLRWNWSYPWNSRFQRSGYRGVRTRKTGDAYRGEFGLRLRLGRLYHAAFPCDDTRSRDHGRIHYERQYIAYGSHQH